MKTFWQVGVFALLTLGGELGVQAAMLNNESGDTAAFAIVGVLAEPVVTPVAADNSPASVTLSNFSDLLAWHQNTDVLTADHSSLFARWNWPVHVAAPTASSSVTGPVRVILRQFLMLGALSAVAGGWQWRKLQAGA